MLALTKDNKVVHIDNAVSKVDYYCAKCGGKLRVKNGKIRAKHFYHLNIDCGDKGESLIHKCWKKYFLKQKEFDEYNIIEAREEVHLLKGEYIPDIVYKTDKGVYIILEICVTNPKPKEYINKYKRLKKLEKVYEIIVEFGKILNIKILYNTKREEDLKKNIEKKEYINKYKRLKKLEKVYEIIVEFGKILNIKILYNTKREEDLKKNIEKKRKYILETYYEQGGLLYEALKQDKYDPPFLRPQLNKDILVKYGEEPIDSTWKKFVKREISLALRGKKIKIYLEEQDENIKVKSESFYITIYDYKNMEYFFDMMNVSSIKLISKDINLKGDINIVLDK